MRNREKEERDEANGGGEKSFMESGNALPKEPGIHVVEENAEGADFWFALRGNSTETVDRPPIVDGFQPRLFHFSGATGQFLVRILVVLTNGVSFRTTG